VTRRRAIATSETRYGGERAHAAGGATRRPAAGDPGDAGYRISGTGGPISGVLIGAAAPTNTTTS
jgi:hypothetical protein